ncbi:MAG TPA: hypothetical protein VKQ36_01165 [Ktedonobacterales bacterium]|nr:hypothetical protein [Ktedonobacterales bacterium]
MPTLRGGAGQRPASDQRVERVDSVLLNICLHLLVSVPYAARLVKSQRGLAAKGVLSGASAGSAPALCIERCCR